MSPITFDIQPQISVILCTYNRDKYLQNCIDSVINQTFENWELLIVDDGSQDETFRIIEPYLDKLNNIRYLKHKNRKQSLSRNAGIQASFGNYLTFIDSDDSYKPNHLQSRYEYMQNHPDVDLIQGGFYCDEEIFVVDYFQVGKLINLRECVLAPTFFGKRKVFFELKGFNAISYGEDPDFWERAKKSFKLEQLTEPQTYVYTRAETSITKEVIEKNALSS